jgi:6,7-dimethyl-8-ribityllumazine synthase
MTDARRKLIRWGLDAFVVGCFVAAGFTAHNTYVSHQHHQQRAPVVLQQQLPTREVAA